MTLRSLLRGWVDHYLSDEEAVILLVVLVLGFAVVIWLGRCWPPFSPRWSSPFCCRAG